MSSINTHALGLFHCLHLGQVIDNEDPDTRGRIKVLLLANQLEVWASVVVPSAGSGYGVCAIPRLEEIVVVAFVTQEQPLVLGSIWSGQNSVPEDADAHEDHYVVRTPAGTVMEFDDADGPKLEMRTTGGQRITITDGSEIVLDNNGQTITMTNTDITIKAGVTV